MIRKIVATVLFVQDLDKCKAFYQDILGLQVLENDPESASFLVGDLYFLLLDVTEAAKLISDDGTALPMAGGPRGLLAANVEDVDAAYEDLKAKGVTFLRRPTDQSWGLRTAHFADPEGNIWELHQRIESQKEG